MVGKELRKLCKKKGDGGGRKRDWRGGNRVEKREGGEGKAYYIDQQSKEEVT